MWSTVVVRESTSCGSQRDICWVAIALSQHHHSPPPSIHPSILFFFPSPVLLPLFSATPTTPSLPHKMAGARWGTATVDKTRLQKTSEGEEGGGGPLDFPLPSLPRLQTAKTKGTHPPTHPLDRPTDRLFNPPIVRRRHRRRGATASGRSARVPHAERNHRSTPSGRTFHAAAP
jgi:hypothetical protein